MNVRAFVGHKLDGIRNNGGSVTFFFLDASGPQTVMVNGGRVTKLTVPAPINGTTINAVTTHYRGSVTFETDRGPITLEHNGTSVS